MFYALKTYITGNSEGAGKGWYKSSVIQLRTQNLFIFLSKCSTFSRLWLCALGASWSQDGCYSFRHHDQVQTPGEKWGETMSAGLFLMCLSPVTSEENLRRTLCLLSQKGTTWPPLATRQTAKCFQYQGKGKKLPMLGFNRP